MQDEKTIISLCDLSDEELLQILGDGVPKYRIMQLKQAIWQAKEYDEMTNVPKQIRDKLSAYPATALKISEILTGKDGTEKYLYTLNDGSLIEGVFMLHSYGNTLCVSTQVGCRMGCKFCASGKNGLIRNCTAGEIAGQVLAVNKLKGGTIQKRMITNIVLMGSGEPLDNYDNVIAFLRYISAPDGLNISLRNISLSTCGLVDGIRKLADSELPVTLSISLHSATDEKRSRIMPINNKYKVNEVVSAAKYYFEKTKRRIIFEYSLIKGENSDEKSALELVCLIKGLPCHVNLINLNPTDKGLRGVTMAEIKSFMEILSRNNISNTLRHSMGNDIEGACGQLKAKREGKK